MIYYGRTKKSSGTLARAPMRSGICAIPRPGWLAAAGFPISETRAGPSEPFRTVTFSYLQRAGPPAAGRVSSCIDTLGGAGRLRGPPASCSRAFVAVLARRSPWNPFSNFSAPVRSTVCQFCHRQPPLSSLLTSRAVSLQPSRSSSSHSFRLSFTLLTAPSDVAPPPCTPLLPVLCGRVFCA